MLINTDKMISITELQKQLPKIIRDIDSEKTKVFVSRRNKIKAVIMSTEEYETLLEAAGLLEELDISENLKKRMKNYNPDNNISWEDIKAKYEL
ncbi:type II toxin-antitoxin system Phd/YefM family antitoxin [Hippea alviniae]|uniref:type II toxin-antitoxin system Phd/YefM family antitoxin n=1 Tax=Hippea alviniae TaxID=1279027 RepID=UPI0003B77D42|nr:type II toxin-antitoxin system Phd/YefM family antitoxin [Hippea alviniae]